MLMSDYHRMSAAEKRTEALDRIREPAMRCPCCDYQVMPVDLLKHLSERCQGRKEPHAGAKWVSKSQAIQLCIDNGVSAMTLSVWTRRCYVRFRGPRGAREYLLRDLVLRIALERPVVAVELEQKPEPEPVQDATSQTDIVFPPVTEVAP